jgi:hypothetical protein
VIKPQSLRTFLLIVLTLPGLLAGCASRPAQASLATPLPLPSVTQVTQVTQAAQAASSEAVTLSPSLAATPAQEASTALAPTPLLETPSEPAESSATPAGWHAPDNWRSLPIIPTVSDRARAIYQAGLGQGNLEHAFSKIGDCESQAVWFLTDFDHGPSAYSLGPFGYLQSVIDYFPGSFKRTSMAAKSSFNAASLMSPLWADRSACQPDESPLDCELRIWRPSLALVMLGTNDSPRPADFEGNLRKVLDSLVGRGVLPVLATKADNLEGDNRINAIIARLAVEYDIPLWNYWRAMQPLPDHGLQNDGAHLTNGPNRFDDPKAMQSGWTVRNLTALQALEAVWRGVTHK